MDTDQTLVLFALAGRRTTLNGGPGSGCTWSGGGDGEDQRVKRGMYNTRLSSYEVTDSEAHVHDMGLWIRVIKRVRWYKVPEIISWHVK
ncbi:hypothetical protein Tco_0491308 [Tanacetum coccineum]